MKKMILSLLALLMTAATGAWAQSTTTHKVTMKSGTKDAANWTISDGTTTATGAEGLDGVAEDATVTLTYTGRLKVKSVTATHDGWNGNLSNIPASAIASDGYTVIVPDGTTLTGTLSVSPTPYKIVIPDRATVTLAGVTIKGTNAPGNAYRHAGITCEGDATIILADNSANTVKGFNNDYPGIYVPEGKTLKIKGGSEGTGSLTASPYDGGGTPNSYGAGIGGAFSDNCGNIVIEGGVITATGGCYAAGIGGSDSGNWGDITISGGKVTAKGGDYAAGIGSGYRGGKKGLGNISITGGTVDATGGYNCAGIGCGYGKTEGGITTKSICGNISISKYVTIVTATKGMDATNSIGISDGDYSSCGTVTIGCELDSEGKPKSGTGTVYYDGETKSYQNGGATYLAQSPLTLVNLGKLTGNYEAPNGTTLFGTLKGSEQPYKVSIADGATVTLDGVDIEGVNDDNCPWAGLTCAGDATIILNDGSENTVKGFYKYYPGIFVPKDKTLTIKSRTADPGKLMASPFDGGTDESYGAGIGGGNEIVCGKIIIQGGIITATGGKWAAGIGGGPDAIWGDITISGGEVTAQGGNNAAGIGSGDCGGESGCGKISITGGTVIANGGQNGAGIGSGFGYDSDPSILYSYCGNINISGGTITATGGKNAAGIGTGYQYSQCGNIEITSGVNHVTAKKGDGATESIGKSRIDPQSNNSCGTVTLPDDTSKVTQE
jgi:hypothetical protein